MKYHFFHVVGVRPDLKFAHLQYNCVDKSDISWKMKIEIKFILRHTCMRKNTKLQRKIYLGIQWEIIKYHGTYECDLGCLRVHYLIPSIYPQSSQLGQDIYYLKNKRKGNDHSHCIERNSSMQKIQILKILIPRGFNPPSTFMYNMFRR